MLEDYEINSSTLALIPVNYNECLVMEEDESYTVKKTSTDIIDHSCKFFGSSLRGRHDGASSVLGSSYKTPIVIEDSTTLVFFPTSSTSSENCYWISLKHVDKYEKKNDYTTLTFKNGKQIDIQISKYSLQNQILRASRLESIMSRRKFG